MKRAFHLFAATLAALLLTGKASATGEINVLTDLLSPFPAGCVALSLPAAPVSEDNVLQDVDIRVPSIGSTFRDAELNVQIWRVGCADEGFSVVMVRLNKVFGDEPVLIPQVFVEAGQVDVPFHEAQLITHPAVGNVGASGNVLPGGGQTFMLAADPLAVDGLTDFFPEDYNGLFTLELSWDAYSPFLPPEQRSWLFDIDGYEPAFDPPQFEAPLLHGRMTGAYVFDNKPAAGLFLNVGENFDRIGSDDNFVFAAFYTYLNGEPYWMVGSTGSQEPGLSVITIPMFSFSGGDFFTMPPSYTDADLDVARVGTLTIEVQDCNRLLLGYDFREGNIGVGAGSLQAQRLIHIAGYDCNPWR